MHPDDDDDFGQNENLASENSDDDTLADENLGSDDRTWESKSSWDDDRSDDDDMRSDDDDDMRSDDDDDAPAEREEISPELLARARSAKANRLFKEENNRPPHSYGELSHFILKGNIERPIVPDDEDIETARKQAAKEGG